MNEEKIKSWGNKAEGAVQETVGNVVDDKSLQFKGAAKKALGEAQHALGKAEDYAHDVESYVNEKPLKSTLIALGVGFVLGRLLGS